MSTFGRPQTNVFDMPVDAFSVIVEEARGTVSECIEYVQQNCMGDWSYDWTHGEHRSDPAELRRQHRFLFTNQAAAAMFRMRFG